MSCFSLNMTPRLGAVSPPPQKELLLVGGSLIYDLIGIQTQGYSDSSVIGIQTLCPCAVHHFTPPISIATVYILHKKGGLYSRQPPRANTGGPGAPPIRLRTPTPRALRDNVGEREGGVWGREGCGCGITGFYLGLFRQKRLQIQRI